MVIAQTVSLDQPHISGNQLGEFPFASTSRRLQMLTDQKFGNAIRAPYYHSATCTVLRSFCDGEFNQAVIATEMARLRGLPARNRYHAAKLNGNVQMLQRFLELTTPTVPATGEHTVIRRNAKLVLDDVVISVRPEITTRHPKTGLFSLTKFRFSKSKVSADSSEVILLLLLKYGQSLSRSGWQLEPAETRLVDCHARLVLHGHTLHRFREQQLQTALREIRRLWPHLKRPERKPDRAFLALRPEASLSYE